MTADKDRLWSCKSADQIGVVTVDRRTGQLGSERDRRIDLVAEGPSQNNLTGFAQTGKQMVTWMSLTGWI